MTALHWLSAAQLARDFATRKLSPVELVQALLDRAAALDPQINAYIRLDADAALAAARAAAITSEEADWSAARKKKLAALLAR